MRYVSQRIVLRASEVRRGLEPRTGAFPVTDMCEIDIPASQPAHIVASLPAAAGRLCARSDLSPVQIHGGQGFIEIIDSPRLPS
jgi:hypothetical protein